MNPAIYPALLHGALISGVLFFVFWALHLKLKNAGLVDLAWVLGLLVMATAAFLDLGGDFLRKSLIFFMVSVWGFRLSSHLVLRFLKEPAEDARYRKMRQDFGSKANQSFFYFFLFQAVLVPVLSLPFFIASANSRGSLSEIEILGFLLWLAAVLGESISDRQLRRFKADPANRGKVCQTGLWNYSRHPNYFFECVIWVSYFVFALGSPGGVWAAISPILMIFFIVRVSGVPPAEAQSLASRGDLYRQYQKTTSVLVPLPKRKV